ncbi:helix-turn-helix domain-containing protein [Bradyrhizobium sp. CSS354]|uniref:helix-turn-helix domain-containing protein n=1 Tax=Bradyrhizobium sp. CSS354 TaxID=2699172 RepID=UPI0023AE8F37|nr:helix-turn-helix domain-containing protein [Bradyrhizobium sp. CSS354]MDE5460321.1 excisionase family DNA-binding protein [Bradyrhizobium sp. CSS354]
MKAQNSVATGEAARRLNVAPATIQRWVDSGLLRAERTNGGHRRIPVAELRRLIASMRPPELAKPLAAWLDAMLTGDSLRLKTMFLVARERCGDWAQVADELASVIVEIGRLWEAGDCNVFQEHIASEAFRRAAAACVNEISSDGNASRVAILQTMPGERHTLGLSLAELVLVEAGLQVHWVGEGPPAEELAPLLKKLKPDVLVVSGSSYMTRRATATYQDHLRQTLTSRRLKLFLAGSAPWVPMRNARLVGSFRELHTLLGRLPASNMGPRKAQVVQRSMRTKER